MDKPVLLEVKDLKTYFYSGKHALKAVDSVSFSIREGEVFGLSDKSQRAILKTFLTFRLRYTRRVFVAFL